MGQILCDIFTTSKNRPDLLAKFLECIRKRTDHSDYRLHVVQDGYRDELVSPAEMSSLVLHPFVDHVLYHRENLGLGPSVNQALAHIESLNQWYAHPTHGDPTQVAPFVAYIQDDVLVQQDGWLRKLVQLFTLLEQPHNLGFASGVECVEHKGVGRDKMVDIGGGLLLKRYVRAAFMFGRREYWMSMWPVPRLDPETGRVRSKPNDGIGSGADWHFIRNHPNSVEKTGRMNLVVPALAVHAGYDRSTWLKREMPESEADKARVRAELDPEKMHGYSDQFGGSDFE